MTMPGLFLATLVLSVGAASADDWFPDWDGGSGKCLVSTGSNAPIIFQEHDGYYEETENACCARYFSGDAADHCQDSTMSGQNHTGTGNWYAKWNDDPDRCAKDCPTDYGDASCGGVLGQFGSAAPHGSVAACCSSHFPSLVSEYCITISQEQEYPGTKDWYLDSSENICLQDCDGAAPCGGVITQTWQTLYESSEACCEDALSSLDTDFCMGLSNSTYSGTNKWFVDSQDNVCKKDCTGTGDECARATRWDDLYDDAEDCCAAKLSWMNEDFCESRSDPTTYGVSGEAHTDMWFVDYSNHVCAKDCSGSNPSCADLDQNPQGLYDTVEACCSAKLSYLDADECKDWSEAGAEGEPDGSGDWYASYSAKKCVKDCPDGGDDLCGGVVGRSNGVTKYDSAADCCSNKFGWYNQDLCVAMSDGTETTGQWYVDYQESVCVNDCPTSGGGPSCAGPPDDWGTPLYKTAAACCSAKLNWLDGDACKLKSENGADAEASGTNKWYAAYSDGRCAKDCAETGADVACKGVVESNAGHQMYETALACCTGRFGWVNSEYCKTKSESDGAGNSDLYWADQQAKVCYRDCASGDNCKEPTNLSVQLFDSIETCCTQRLNWVNKDKCMQVAEADQGSDEWWINWTLNKCVKNCPTSQGSECGGLAESWDIKYGSSGTCCAQPAFAWDSKKNCKKS